MSEIVKTNKTLFPGPVIKLLKALDGAGFFEQSMLVGSWVMPLYQEFFEIDYALRTMDIDLAVRFVPGKKDRREDLAATITSLGYVSVFTQSGLQKFSRENFAVEFIAQRKGGRDDPLTFVPEWNITAVPLPFIDMLLDFPFTAQLKGFRVRAPLPEAFFIHKLITADRRRGDEKRSKDLEQCSVIAPRLELTRLQDIAATLRISKRTKVAIRSSCEAIGFPPHFLSS